MFKISFFLRTFAVIALLSMAGYFALAQPAIMPLGMSSFSADASKLAVPDPFNKVSPLNGAVGQAVSDLLLKWNPSTPNVTYQYCLRTNNNCPGPKWVSVGTNTSVTLSGLTSNTKYYWQVRAVDAQNNYTYANGGAMWSFTTMLVANLPGAFDKLTPLDAATNQPVAGLGLSWSASTLAASYQYCYDTVNNNTCDIAWANSTGLSATIGGLAYGTTYYWQVRAVNPSGNVQADASTWFYFQTQVEPPGAFGKTAPARFVVDQSLSLTLSWGASQGTGITYQYCLATSPCSAGSGWTSTGTNLTANVSGLANGTTYYWQVRATNPTGTVYADSNQPWSFLTIIAGPLTFNKTSPGNFQSGQPLSLSLNWEASSGTNVTYEYCVSTSACTTASTWQLAGTSTSASLSGLAYGTLYFWQVRAVNTSGTTYANGGTVHQFTTQDAPPLAFSKLSPSTSSPNKVPLNVTLQWSASVGAARYFYCVDTVSHSANDASCGPGWVLNNTTESSHLNLDPNQTYYWQVYAENSLGTRQADSGVWWSFTTLDTSPVGFTKIAPAELAPDQPLNQWLYWGIPTTPGNTYQYCIHTATDCQGGTWTDATENVPIHVPAPLANDTTYYWQIRAENGGFTYADGAYYSFTTIKAPPTSSDNQTFDTNEGTPKSSILTATSNYGKAFSLYGSAPAGTLDLHSDGSFTYTPVAYFNGAVTFQFVVADGYNTPAGPFTATINVLPVNNAPTLAAIDPMKVYVGQQVTFWAVGTDQDLPYGDSLTYSIDEVLPGGAGFNAQTGFFHWAVPLNQPAGTYSFTMRVTDEASLSATRVVNITVAYYTTYLPFLSR